MPQPDPLASTVAYAAPSSRTGPDDWEPPDFGEALERSAPAGLTSGSIGYGAGGPTFLDAYRSQRPPLPTELVDAYKAVAYACIQLNAKGVSKVPLRLYAVRKAGGRKLGRSFARVDDRRQAYLRGLSPTAAGRSFARSIGVNDEIDEILDHPILDAIENPNPFFDATLLKMYAVVCMDAVGAAYIHPTRPIGADGYGDPTWAPSELWPIQPQYVYAVKSMDGGLVQSWRYFGDTFGPADLIRVRHVSLRDPYLSQYAPLHACYEQSTLGDYYTASVEGMLKGGAMPNIAMTAKDPYYRADDKARDRMEADINRKFTGPRKGRVWFVDGAFDVHTLSYGPTDLGGLELSKNQRLLAANCFDVPISLLQSENSNRATAAESTYQHQYYGIAPRCALIDGALTHQLCRPIDENLFLAFDDPVRRDTEQETRIWDMKIKSGAATINEARADDGMPPVTWGDEPWLPTGLAQPSAAEPDGDEPTKADPSQPQPTAPAGDDVQGQALNGAQISSLVEVLANVRDGGLPASAAKAVIAAAFPTLPAATIAAMVDPIEVDDEPEPQPPKVV